MNGRSTETGDRRGCAHDPAEVVAGQPIFGSLSDDECRTLTRRAVCRGVRAGETLFREGQPCSGLYLVVDGVVRVYRANRDAREQVLGVFGAGDSLGEVSLFDEGPYLATARVQSPGRVLYLPFGEVHALYRSHPRVMHAVVREMGGRVRKLVALLDRVALHDVPTRVAAALLEYAEQAGAASAGRPFRLPRTQDQLAGEVGAARETVARALRDLREAGTIAQRGRTVSVLDLSALRRAAGGRRRSTVRRDRSATTAQAGSAP